MGRAPRCWTEQGCAERQQQKASPGRGGPLTSGAVGLTRRCLGPGPVQGLEQMKLSRCFVQIEEGHWSHTNGFPFEGEKPRMALKQANDSVRLVTPLPQSWRWIRLSLGMEQP